MARTNYPGSKKSYTSSSSSGYKVAKYRAGKSMALVPYVPRQAGYPTRDVIAAEVQRALTKRGERKMCSTTMGMTNFNSGIDSAGDVQRLMPQVQQGYDDGQRIANQVTAQSLHVKGHFEMTTIPGINFSTSSAPPSNSRVMVRLMAVSPKRFPNYPQASANATTWLPNLLRNGVATQGFTGIIQDLYLPINTDEVTCHYDKTFLLTIDSNGTYGSPASWAAGGFTVDKSVKFFDFYVKCKSKTIDFVDGTGDATSFSPILVLGYAHLDGTSPDVLTTQVAASFVSTLAYKDM